MRIPIFLMFTSLMVQPALSEPPTKAQIEAQMQQALQGMAPKIAEMEKEIEDAKANNENPETIQQMEKNLANMKKMLGMMDNAGSMMNNTPPANLSVNQTAAYNSPITPITLSGPIVVPTPAQATQRLLWYRGRLMNDSTLVTTHALVVRYSQNRNMVITQPKKSTDPFEKIIKEQEKTDQCQNDFVTKMAGEKNSFFMYPEIEKAYKEYDIIEENYDEILNNTIDLPEMPGVPPVNPASSPGSNAAFEAQMKQAFENEQQKLKDLINHPPSLDFPAPPERPVDLCLYCDSTLRKKFEAEIDKWEEQFSGYENKLMQTALGIERQLQLLGYNDDSAGTDYSAFPGLREDLDKASQLYKTRTDQKLKKLREQYGKDIKRQTTVVQKILGAERQQQLLGLSDDAEASGAVQEAGELLIGQDFENYMDQQAQAKNYNVVLDISLCLGYERQRQLLGSSDEDSYWKWWEKLKNYNRFAMTLALNFNVVFNDTENKPMMRITGYVSTIDKIYLNLGRSSDCKWKLYLTEPDYNLNRMDEKAFEIPMIVNEGVKLVKEKDDTWKTYYYSGPREMRAVLPSFRIGFCANQTKDSVLMDVLRYDVEDLSPYAASLKKGEYTVDLLEYVNFLFVSLPKMENSKDALLNLGFDIIDFANGPPILENPTGNAKLDEMQIGYTMENKTQAYKKKIMEQTKDPKSVIEFDAANGQAVLINITKDVARTIKATVELKKGEIQISVVHEPK